MSEQTRRVHFADTDFDHASAVLGVSTRDVEITKMQSEEWSAAMAMFTTNQRVNKRRVAWPV